jgi:hypothetical protein
MSSMDGGRDVFSSEHNPFVPEFIPHKQPQFVYSTPIRKLVPFDEASTPIWSHGIDPVGRAYFRQPVPEALCVANSSEIDYNEASNEYDEYALEQEDSFFKAWSALMSHLPFSALSHTDSDDTKLARQTNRDRARYLLCVLSTCLQAEPWEEVVFPKTHLFDSLIAQYPDNFETDLDRTLVEMIDLPSERKIRRIYVPTPPICENLHRALFDPSGSIGSRVPVAGTDKLGRSSAGRSQRSSPCPSYLLSRGSAGCSLARPDPESADLSRNCIRGRSRYTTLDRPRHASQGPSRVASQPPPTPDAGRPTKKPRIEPPSNTVDDDARVGDEAGTHAPVSHTRRMPNANRGGGKTRGVWTSSDVHSVASVDFSQGNTHFWYFSDD